MGNMTHLSVSTLKGSLKLFWLQSNDKEADTPLIGLTSMVLY
jgi:hypothetical protein